MTLKFKTSIRCGGCVAKVTPFLDGEKTISAWQVDTANPDKILTVDGEHLDGAAVVRAVESAGFLIQPVD